MSLVEAQEGMTGLLVPSAECGAEVDGRYTWSQTDSDVTVTVPLPPGTTGKQIDVRISTGKLFVKLKGAETAVLDGELFKPIKQEDSTWSIEEKKMLQIYLQKGNRQYEEWWPHVCVGEPQIDMKLFKPPSKHMRDLDDGAQAQIQKMMFDQEQKRKGLPTSEELQYATAMQKFKEQFPGVEPPVIAGGGAALPPSQ
jgi:hypothetical protein